MMTDTHLVLKRKTGWLGQIDFYRVDPMGAEPKTVPSLSS